LSGGDADPLADLACRSGVLAINEVAPAGEGPDWIELYAHGEEAVTLSAYSVIDDNPDHSPAALPEVTLQPGEFLVIYAVSADEATSDEVPFKLGGADSLRLLAGDGVEVDAVSWEEGAAPAGVTWGRLPDGSGPFQQLSPTPGTPNRALDGPVDTCVDPFITDRVIDVELDISEESWEAIQADPLAEEFHMGAFVFDGVRVDDVGIRTKGNSSLNFTRQAGSNRFSFKVDFNRYVEGLKFCGLGKLVLNNGFKDPTLLREYLAYRLAREFGMSASRTAFVDLSIAGHHMGLYTMVEPVDDDFFLIGNFDDDQGDLYKPGFPDATLPYKGDSFSDYQGIAVENNENSTDHSALMNLIDVINHGPEEAYEEVLDVEGVLRYLAFNTVLVNEDSYTGSGHNYYVYEQDDRFTLIPWDLNEAFGNYSCGCGRDGIITFLVDEPTCGPPASKPIVEALLNVPERRQRYHELLQELLDDLFTHEEIGVWALDAADMIRPFVEADPTMMYSFSQFEQGLVEDVLNQDMPGGQVAIGLAAFIEERRASIAAQLADTQPSTNGGDGNCGGDGPGPGGPCPDGICDEFEQSNPEICPQDCQ